MPGAELHQKKTIMKSPSIRALFLAIILAPAAGASYPPPPVPDLRGTWHLTTDTFSAIVRINQTSSTPYGAGLSGDMTFTGNPCVATATFTGSINVVLGVSLTMNVDMNGQPVSFSGAPDAHSGNAITGFGYSASRPGCIGKGNWAATRPITLSAVTNAAGLAPFRSIAPGEILSIFSGNGSIGPTPGAVMQLDLPNRRLPTTLGGTQVLFSGIPAPLIFAGNGQINAIVPYELAGLTNVSLEVIYLGDRSDPIPLPVTPTAPGIFTADSTGLGQAAALNYDGSLNTPNHPEPRGGIVTLFLTGEGQTIPTGVTGTVTGILSYPWLSLTPVPAAPVSVFLNGQPATVAFSGEAPELVAGLLQLNVKIPETVSPGNVAVKVWIGDIGTYNAVTISIK
jgi:uncharacterized protein (TIGR03437 family)